MKHLSVGGVYRIKFIKNSLIPNYWFLTIFFAGDNPMNLSTRERIYSKCRRSVKYPVNR